MKPTTFKWMLHGAGLSIVLIVGSLAYGFLFRPMKTESQHLESTRREQTVFLATSDSLYARNRELKSRLEETEQMLAAIKRRIPDSAREADFLAQLAAAAENSNVEIVDYRPANAIKKERHSSLTIELSAKGNYVSMCRFLDRLEKLPRLCHITGMNVDASGRATENYRFDLTLQVFFSPARPAVAQQKGNING